MAVPGGLGIYLQRTRICWAPPVYSLSFVPCSAQVTHTRIHSHHHILRQGQHRLKVCLTPGPFYLCPAFWNLISAPFKPLSSTFMTGSSSPGSGFQLQSHPTYRFCSLRCSCRWSFNTETHTQTHKHTHLQFPHSETLCENSGNCGNPCCLSMDFLKDWCFILFFILGNIVLKRQKVSGQKCS